MPPSASIAHTEPMEKRLARERLLLAAAVITWAAVGLPHWLLAWNRVFGGEGGAAPSRLLATWTIAHGAFLILLLAAERIGRANGPRWICRSLLVVQTAAALTAAAAFGDALQAALLVIVATQAALLLGTSGALAWIAVQSAVLGVVLGREGALPAVLALTAAFVGFQLFGLLVVTMAERESAARAELARTNAELEAARELLAERSRTAERLRISRELHDGLGHHLTALRLQLEVAAHAGDERSAEAIARSREISGRILDDLRRAVRELREEPPVDLAAALGLLAAGIPRPAIHLGLPDRLEVEDPARAHALLRSVQELVTNSVRHSGADNLWLEVGRDDGWLEIAARDDGAGAARFEPGSGLAGLRERIEGLGGAVELDPGPGSGFRVRLRIPATDGGRESGA